MERIELPGGMYLEISSEAKDAFNLRGHGKNWLNNIAREKAIEFASYMNTSQAELAKVQEQLRVAVEALSKLSKKTVAVFEHSGGKRVFMGDKQTESAFIASTALQQITALSPGGSHE